MATLEPPHTMKDGKVVPTLSALNRTESASGNGFDDLYQVPNNNNIANNNNGSHAGAGGGASNNNGLFLVPQLNDVGSNHTNGISGDFIPMGDDMDLYVDVKTPSLAATPVPPTSSTTTSSNFDFGGLQVPTATSHAEQQQQQQTTTPSSLQLQQPKVEVKQEEEEQQTQQQQQQEEAATITSTRPKRSTTTKTKQTMAEIIANELADTNTELEEHPEGEGVKPTAFSKRPTGYHEDFSNTYSSGLSDIESDEEMSKEELEEFNAMNPDNKLSESILSPRQSLPTGAYGLPLYDEDDTTYEVEEEEEEEEAEEKDDETEKTSKRKATDQYEEYEDGEGGEEVVEDDNDGEFRPGSQPKSKSKKGVKRGRRAAAATAGGSVGARGRPAKKSKKSKGYESTDKDGIPILTTTSSNSRRRVPISLQAAGATRVTLQLPLRRATYESFTQEQEWDALPTQVSKQDRNRIAAKRSRERKKLYIKSLEESVEIFVRENDALYDILNTVEATVENLEANSKISKQDAQTLKQILERRNDGSLPGKTTHPTTIVMSPSPSDDEEAAESSSPKARRGRKKKN